MTLLSRTKVVDITSHTYGSGHTYVCVHSDQDEEWSWSHLSSSFTVKVLKLWLARLGGWWVKGIWFCGVWVWRIAQVTVVHHSRNGGAEIVQEKQCHSVQMKGTKTWNKKTMKQAKQHLRETPGLSPNTRPTRHRDRHLCCSMLSREIQFPAILYTPKELLEQKTMAVVKRPFRHGKILKWPTESHSFTFLVEG